MRPTWFAYLALVTSLTACLTKDTKCPADHVRKDGLCVADNASTIGDSGLDGGGDPREPDDDAGRDFFGPDAGDPTPVTDAALDATTPDSALPAPCYRDDDGDGFGAGKPVECTDPTGDGGADGAVLAQSANDRDCDDDNAGRAPGLMETCDSLDDDCDGEIDEGLKNECGGACGQRLDHAPGAACTNGLLGGCARAGKYICQGGNAVTCDAPSVNPSNEVCSDQIDNDCDGQTNESDAADAATWYQDCDGDGYAASTSGALRSCLKPALLGACSWTSVIPQVGTKTNWDCNDASKNYSPAVTAYGLPVDGSSSSDRNCNGTADKDPGIVEADGKRRALCTEVNALGCGHWKNAAGDYVLTQPACSASAANTYPAAYRYLSGTITMPGPAFFSSYAGLQLCR